MVSNNKLARVAGCLYLIMIIAGGFAEAVDREGLMVPGDAVATIHNILACFIKMHALNLSNSGL